jgi:hypothetical protein
MNPFRTAILSTAAVTILCGCLDTTAPEKPAAAANPAPASSGLDDPNEMATVRSIALQVSSRAGVSSPKTMHAVAAADHQAAESMLSGAIVNDHAPVYVITMTGGPFTATRHPPQLPAPQGNVLRVTVDAATHRVTDIGYVDVEPDLSQMGSHAVDMAAR